MYPEGRGIAMEFRQWQREHGFSKEGRWWLVVTNGLYHEPRPLLSYNDLCILAENSHTSDHFVAVHAETNEPLYFNGSDSKLTPIWWLHSMRDGHQLCLPI